MGAVDGQRDAFSARRHEVDPKRSTGRNNHGPSVIGVAERIDRGTNAVVWKARARRPGRRLGRKHIELETPWIRLGLLGDEDEVRGVLLCPEGKTGLPSAIGCAARDERKLGALLPVDGDDGVEVVLRVEDH